VALIVLDASVVIAVLDPNDALHSPAVAAVDQRAGDDLRLPASAYAETLVAPARRGDQNQVKSKLSALMFVIEPISESIAEEAAEVRARHPAVRLGDALVIATGERLAASEVLTADRRWRGLSKRVRLLA
jgi:predicted nucleic acid-binding protein